MVGGGACARCRQAGVWGGRGGNLAKSFCLTWWGEDLVPLAMTPRVGLPLHSGTYGQATDVAAAQPFDLEPRFGGTPWQLAGKVLVDMRAKTPNGTPPRTVASSMATAPNDRTGVMMPPKICPQQFVHGHVLTKDRPQLFLHTCRKGGTPVAGRGDCAGPRTGRGVSPCRKASHAATATSGPQTRGDSGCGGSGC